MVKNVNTENGMKSVTLLKAHSHNDVDYPEGSVIEVDAFSYAWLLERKIITDSSAALPAVST